MTTASTAPASPRGTPFPLSAAQRRLLRLHRLDRTGHAQSTARCFVVDGAIDPVALRHAAALLTARHEPLRTVFRPDASATGTGTGTVQLVLPAGELPVTLLPRPGTGSVLGAEPRSAARRFAERPFDTERGPLARIALIPLRPGRSLLVVCAHLLAADGWSWEVMLRELGVLYSAALSGTDPDLPELPLQYADWAHWQNQRAAGPRGDALRRWWSAELAGTAVPDAARPAGTPERPTGGRQIAGPMPPATAGGLNALARSEGVTPFTVLAASLGALIGRIRACDDLLLCTPVAHREQAGVENVLGFLTDHLPLRVVLDGDPPFTALLHRVAATVRRAYAHRDLPYENSTACLRRPGAPEGPRVPPVLAHHPRGSTGSLVLAGCRVREEALPSDTARFDLTVRVSELAEGTLVRLEHDTAALAPAAADELLAGYLALLDAVAESPTARLSHLLTASM
ncbi:condensation domain-containing protein [Streptomyces sp. NPDC090022]|uniref:condensation domain-containing protein n=1 Tax=Streptomyces sp. NPDC090022 TaxID=3365920 RepID=UPI00381D4A33